MKLSKKYKTSKTPKDLALDLDLSPLDAIEWQVRYDLTQKIIETISLQALTVTEVAKKSQTSRGRITKILKKETEGISLDVLFRVVGALGHQAKIVFKKAA